MGYKRMKKRRLMIPKKSIFWKWLRGNGKLIEGVIEVPKECMKDFGTMGGDKVSPGASDRGKWVESPNVEGYLDM